MPLDPPAGNPLQAEEPSSLTRGQRQTTVDGPSQGTWHRAGIRRGVGTLPAALSARPNALALLKALRRCWRRALGVGLLLAAALGTAAWFLVPPSKHSVRTLLFVPPTRPYLVRTAENTVDLHTHQRNQVFLLTSRFVLNAALKDPKVGALSIVAAQPNPVEWLEKEVQADFSVAPEVLRITMSGDKPEELVVLVDALRAAYVKEVVERETNQRLERLATLRGFREKYEVQIRANRDTQKALEQMTIARDGGARGLMLGFLQQQVGQMERDLFQTRAELKKTTLQLEAEQAREKKLNELPIPDPVVDAQVDQHPRVKELTLAAQELQQKIDRNLANATRGEKEPVIIELRKQLASLQESLTAQRKKVRPEIVQAFRDKAAADLGASLSKLRGGIEGLESTEKMLQDQIASARARVAEVAKNGSRLDDSRDDLSQIEDLNKKILGEELALNIEREAPKPERTLEPATITHAWSKTRQIAMTTLAAAAGLALSLLAFSWWEFRARKVDAPDEVAHGLEMAVVGTLPDSTRPVPRRLLPRGASPDAYGQALLTESVDAARTMLVHAARLESVQVVMVTSAMPGEGKTSVASHLAASLARTGLKTLLIDGDLRNPTVHRLFELPNGLGFSDLLRGTAGFAEVTQQTGVGGLSLIAAGKWDGQAAQGLAQNRARAILDQLRGEYDFILVDSSPLLLVADALLLGQSVDAAVFSVLRDVSRLPNLYVASQRLTTLGIRTLGAVVSGVPGELYVSAYHSAGAP
jgi:capsular exopolysaccharide synthesis family protein